MRNSTQWHAIAIILTNTLDRGDSPDVVRAWQQIDTIFEKYNDDVSKSGDAVLWKPLVTLWADASLRRTEQQRLRPELVEHIPSGSENDPDRFLDPVYDQWLEPSIFNPELLKPQL